MPPKDLSTHTADPVVHRSDLNRLFAAMMRQFGSDSTVAAKSGHVADVMARYPSCEVMLAKLGGKAVGVACYSVIFPDDDIKPILYMGVIFVLAEASSQGVGTELVGLWQDWRCAEAVRGSIGQRRSRTPPPALMLNRPRIRGNSKGPHIQTFRKGPNDPRAMIRSDHLIQIDHLPAALNPVRQTKTCSCVLNSLLRNAENQIRNASNIKFFTSSFAGMTAVCRAASRTPLN